MADAVDKIKAAPNNLKLVISVFSPAFGPRLT